MESNQSTPTAQPSTVQDAAKTIFDTLTDEGFSPAEKIEIVREVSSLIRIDLDSQIAALTKIRSSI